MSGRFPQLSSVDLLYDVIVDVFRRVINYGAVFGPTTSIVTNEILPLRRDINGV